MNMQRPSAKPILNALHYPLIGGTRLREDPNEHATPIGEADFKCVALPASVIRRDPLAGFGVHQTFRHGEGGVI